MVILTTAFNKLSSFDAVVIGDLMLDKYTVGAVRRISPEAPVSVLQVESEEYRPGGAGNVALNMTTLGGNVTMIGRIGNDDEGRILRESLQEGGVSADGILEEDGYQTPLKNRVIAEGQQIVRVDHERFQDIEKEFEERVLETFDDLIHKVKVVGISDYAKGFLSDNLLAEIILRSRKAGVPVIVDPKGLDFTKYRYATVIKPNKQEAYKAAGLPESCSIDEVAKRLFEITKAEYIIITRSQEGISLFQSDGTHSVFPVEVRQVRDVTGAGDTVLSTLMCSLGNSLSIEDGIKLANISASIAVEHFGCARVSLKDIAQRLLEKNAVNKVFDEDHTFALKEVLRDKNIVIMGMEVQLGLTPTIFRAIEKYAKNDKRELILYIRDCEPDLELIRILASLKSVSYIVVKNESLDHLCKVINPSEAYIVDGTEIIPLKHAQALLSN